MEGDFIGKSISLLSYTAKRVLIGVIGTLGTLGNRNGSYGVAIPFSAFIDRLQQSADKAQSKY